MRVPLLTLVLCALAASVDAVKLGHLPTQLNPSKAMKKAIQANMEKLVPEHLRGSKLLEQEPSPLMVQLQAKLAKGLNKLPFKLNKLVVPETDATTPVSRRALQSLDINMFASVSPKCKAVLSSVGMDAAQMDNDAYDPALPASFAQCDGAVTLAMGSIFGDDDGLPSNEAIQDQIGFCSAGCKDASLTFLADFGSVCGVDIANFIIDQIKTMPESTPDQRLEKNMSMFIPVLVMAQFTSISQVSVTMAMACTGPSASELCWSKDWFFQEAAMDLDETDGNDDDDECPTGPSYLPTKTEVCEDISPTDEFCTEPALNDCCATNAVAASLAGSFTTMCPFMSVLENMMSVMGEGTDMPCTASIDAICKNPASISAFVSGAAELVGSCCDPAKPGMCASAADAAGKIFAASSPSGGNTFTPPSMLLAVLASTAAWFAL